MQIPTQNLSALLVISGSGKLLPTGYGGYVTVTISTGLASAFISYTSDGSLPTCNSAPKQNPMSFVLFSSADVHAIACQSLTQKHSTSMKFVVVEAHAVIVDVTIGSEKVTDQVTEKVSAAIADSMQISRALVQLTLVKYTGRRLLGLIVTFRILASDLDDANQLQQKAEGPDVQAAIRKQVLPLTISGIQTQIWSPKAESSSNMTIIIIAVVVPVICMLLLSILLYVYRKKKRSKAAALVGTQGLQSKSRQMLEIASTTTAPINLTAEQHKPLVATTNDVSPSFATLGLLQSNQEPGMRFPLPSKGELLPAESSIPSINLQELVIEDKPLASGSFKSVYKAKWTAAGSTEAIQVAVLTLRQGASAALEINIFERLGRHPHLVKLLAVSRIPPAGNMCMVLELALRGSLDNVLQELAEQGSTEQPSNAVLLTAACQVCEAMEILTQYSIIHRDLAARNVLVFSFHPRIRKHVLVKVTDYGLSMVAGQTVVATNSNAGGPIRWMAPESITTRRYSHKSDVYAFGILLWEMWAGGAYPYMLVADDEEVASRVLAGIRPTQPLECPDTVHLLMEQCWKPKAAQRPTFADLKIGIQDAYAAETAAQAVQDCNEQSLCVVCLDKQADFALFPCGHKCVCEDDSALISRQGTCPVCRAPVQSHQRIW